MKFFMRIHTKKQFDILCYIHNGSYDFVHFILQKQLKI